MSDRRIQTQESDRLPSPVSIGLVPKPFSDGYILIAAWKGKEDVGPFGHGDTIGEAINELVDVTEEMLAEAA